MPIRLFSVLPSMSKSTEATPSAPIAASYWLASDFAVWQRCASSIPPAPPKETITSPPSERRAWTRARRSAVPSPAAPNDPLHLGPFATTNPSVYSRTPVCVANFASGKWSSAVSSTYGANGTAWAAVASEVEPSTSAATSATPRRDTGVDVGRPTGSGSPPMDWI